MSLQLAHNSHENFQSKFPIVIVTDNLMGDANIGSIFRLADAFNIEKIIFCGTPVNLNGNRLRRTARSTQEKVISEFAENISEEILKLRDQNYKIYALEITSGSIPLEELNLKKDFKIALIIGNERHGIEESVLKLADKTVHINMFGINSSMNVAQATGIALYEITKSLLHFEKK